MPNPLHRQLLERFIEATTTDTYAIFDEIMTEDYEQVESMIPNGREAVKDFFAMSADALSEKHAEIVWIVSEGDTFVSYMKLHAKHTGTFFAIPASGAEVTVATVDRFTVRDGKLSSHFGMGNPLPYLWQMGVAPFGWPFTGEPLPQ